MFLEDIQNNFGRLAQLVQSTSFTPRGSGVRTPHRPQSISFRDAFFVLTFMDFKVYILFSELKNRFYIGFTSNLVERVIRHNQKSKGFTGNVNDWEVVYVENYDTKEEAQQRELIIKSWKSRTKIQELISKKD
jgi:putative endonuclease